jgi:hypothetical protein
MVVISRFEAYLAFQIIDDLVVTEETESRKGEKVVLSPYSLGAHEDDPLVDQVHLRKGLSILDDL